MSRLGDWRQRRKDKRAAKRGARGGGGSSWLDDFLDALSDSWYWFD